MDMKSATVLLTVILLIGSVSCITKDKAETNVTNDNVLPEIPAKQEIAELPPPPSDSLQIRLPKIIKPVLKPVVEVPVHTISCDLPHAVETEDSSKIFTKVEIEAE